MKKKKEQQNPVEPLQYVRYFDDAYGYEGVGVLTEENEESFKVTSVIGGVLAHRQTNYALCELPGYTMLQSASDYTLRPAVSVPDWVTDFSVSSLTPEDIHHVGVFFETFLLDRRPLLVRLETTIQHSLLRPHVLAQATQHVLLHYREEGDEALLACAVSSVVQSALYHL